MELLKNLINYWIPERFDNRPALRLRATVAVAILFFNLLICAAIQLPILFYISIPSHQVSNGQFISLTMLLCYYLALRHFKQHGSLFIATNTICFITYSIALLLSLTSGSFPSALTVLFVAPPIMAYLLLGKKAGNYWSALIILTEITLAVATLQLGYIPLDLFANNLALFSTIHLIAVTLMVVGAFSLSQHLNEQLQQALFEEKLRLEHLASHDSLTDLHNRRAFENMLNELAKPQQERPFALMLFDINSFKLINDSRGHQAGDYVLKAFATNLKQSVREFDFVARVGGDEFAVILNNLSDHFETKNIIELIAHRLQKNITIDGTPLEPRASIGIAIWPGESSNATELYQKADDAMYQSKREKTDYIISDEQALLRLSASKV